MFPKERKVRWGNMIKLRKDRVAYIQIGNHILKRIATKELLKDNTIGTIRNLASEYQVTTKTIQKTIDYLERIKAITRIQSSGIYTKIEANEAKELLYIEARKITDTYIEEIRSLCNIDNINELIKRGLENDKIN